MTTLTFTDTKPSLALLGLETCRAALELFSNGCMPRSPRGVSGDGHTVIVFPGLGTDGSSTALLRAHCRGAGYDAIDWGQGCNLGPTGNLDDYLNELEKALMARIADAKVPMTFVGWSLGGIYARELAKRMPDAVRQVVTIGTPFNADADPTHAGWILSLFGGRSLKFDPAICRRLRTPPAMPTTSIYSKSDGVVAWQACLHRGRHAQVQHVEVEGSHLGLPWNPAVLQVVERCLGHASAVTA